MYELDICSLDLSKSKADILLIPVFKGEEEKLLSVKKISKSFLKEIYDKLVNSNNHSDYNNLRIIDSPDLSIKKIALLLLPTAKNVTPFELKENFGGAVKQLYSVGLSEIGILHSKSLKSVGILENALEGIGLAAYRFEKYKTQKYKYKFKIFIFLEDSKSFLSANKILKRVKTYLETLYSVRDNVNEPSNILNPPEFKKRCLKLAKHKNIKVRAFNSKQIKHMGMNAIYDVGKGSKNGSILLVIEYLPRGYSKKIALVGKGVTFDTGGYNLKPAKAMIGMKGDMFGAAVVLAVIECAAKLKAKIGMIGIMPVVENTVNESSFKPEDVIKTLSGKTVEVENTDAEGRLLLADSLTYVQKYKPDEIIDMATLAGSCMIALGDFIAPYMTNSDKISKRFERASIESGEVFIRVPKMNEYLRFLKSSLADIKNASFGAGGGILTASMFLSEFVGNNPWMHIDFAGNDYHRNDSSSIYPKGSSGFGIKTILKYLELI